MKKKYVLKKWVEDFIIIGLIIFLAIIIILVLDGLTPKQEEAINNCMEQSYSREYCEKGLLGY
jgi:hypothetical protein